MFKKQSNFTNFIALAMRLDYLSSLSQAQRESLYIAHESRDIVKKWRRDNVDKKIVFMNTEITLDDMPFTRNVIFSDCQFSFGDDYLSFPTGSIVKISNSFGSLVIASSQKLSIELENSNNLRLELWHSDVMVSGRVSDCTVVNTHLQGKIKCTNFAAIASYVDSHVDSDFLELRHSLVKYSSLSGALIDNDGQIMTKRLVITQDFIRMIAGKIESYKEGNEYALQEIAELYAHYSRSRWGEEYWPKESELKQALEL